MSDLERLADLDEEYDPAWADDDTEIEEDDTEAVSGGDLLGPNGPRVCADRCATCIFHPGNRMQLRPGRVRQMVRDSLAGGGFITCHSTLPSTAGPGRAAVCRGFFDAYGHLSNLLRVWSRIGGGFDFVEPPDLHAGPPWLAANTSCDTSDLTPGKDS